MHSNIARALVQVDNQKNFVREVPDKARLVGVLLPMQTGGDIAQEH